MAIDGSFLRHTGSQPSTAAGNNNTCENPVGFRLQYTLFNKSSE